MGGFWQQSVSIVMLTHDDMRHTGSSLATVLDVLDDALIEELLILDNGSTDGTREFVLSLGAHPKVRVLTSEHNLGVAVGRTRLFAAARGSVIASLDSDVVLRGVGYLRRACAALAQDPLVGVCGASGYLVHFDGGMFGLIPCQSEREVDCVSGFCHVFRRSLLDRVQIDCEFSPFWCEDTDFCFQAKALGLRIRSLDPGNDLSHRYRSIDERRNDPRKAAHEAKLVRKWNGRVRLLGERRLPRLLRWLARVEDARVRSGAGLQARGLRHLRYLLAGRL
jgi:GT2 family glycosyltransferase